MKKVDKSSSAGTTVHSSTNADVSQVSQPIGKHNVSCRAKRFDFKSFKKYVETYDPVKHGSNKAEIIFEDMLYGLGLAVDKKHQWSDGFHQFKKWLSSRLHGS